MEVTNYYDTRGDTEMKRYRSSHMIRMEHLNHHGNLYAGQATEWMIETSFIVVCTEYGDPQGLLYKNTHKFDFRHKTCICPKKVVPLRENRAERGKYDLNPECCFD